MLEQPTTAKTGGVPIPHGEERLATQRERDDVNQIMETLAIAEKESVPDSSHDDTETLQKASD